jgi:DNA polymerase-3 subunit delta'
MILATVADFPRLGYNDGMNWDMTGYEWAVTLLQNHIRRDEIRHTYLITGAPGTGKRTLALHFAQALDCLNPPAPGEFCGVCRTCTHFSSMAHPDLMVVKAEGEGKEIKIDQIRQLQSTLSLSPYEARWRIALLLNLQQANEQAQNTLLKTLEEAPAKVILLVTADMAENLLPTIVSRCEQIRLRPLPVEQIESALQGKSADPQQISLAAHLSGGRYGYAANLLDNPDLLEDREQRIEELHSLYGNSIRERFKYAEDLCARGKDLDKTRGILRGVLVNWLNYMRDCMLAAAGSKVPLGNIDYEPKIRQLGAAIGMDEACRITAALEECLDRLDRYINPRLLLEVFLMDLPKISQASL